MSEDPAITTMFDGEPAAIRQLKRSRIVFLSGPGAQEGQSDFKISKARVTGGRSKINDIEVRDKSVSGAHFEIISADDGHRLVDLGSTNGTFVGDCRIREVYLSPGLRFRVGQTEMMFEPLRGVVEIALSANHRFGAVFGKSIPMREIFATLEKVSPSDLTVLVAGETGTGKELVARGIHDYSGRNKAPFVVLDCGAIPKDLVESTLFGHEKGAFTGALGQHKGCFEQANGGTIFLDEIGELELAMQPKLLRVLESRELKRVGGDRQVPVDVRVVAATNRDLRAMVNEGTFREDLFFRLSVISVTVPPLRKRREDIPMLANRFLRDVSKRREMKLQIAVGAMNALINRPWPGNVRELRNMVERAGSLCEGASISRADLSIGRMNEGHLPSDCGTSGGDGADQAGESFGITPPADGEDSAKETVIPSKLFRPGISFKEAKQAVIDVFEERFLRKLLERHDGNITRSANEADLTRYHVRELLKRHKIDPKRALEA